MLVALGVLYSSTSAFNVKIQTRGSSFDLHLKPAFMKMVCSGVLPEKGEIAIQSPA